MKSPTKNEQELEYRIEKIEEILIEHNGLESVKECSKGAINGTVDLMAEIALVKHDLTILNERFEKLLTYLKKRK